MAVASAASLLNNDGAGHQLKINKAGAADTASLVFQTGFSGHAEMGLSGSNDFTINVSDGVNWFTGITVRNASGIVQVDEMLALPPRDEPANGAAGDIYFDSALSKLRCHDGTLWQNLF